MISRLFHRETHAEFRAGSFRKYLVFVLLVAFGYLGQVCVMPYVKIGSVTPNLLYAVIGIVTVAYGRIQAFWVGLIYGLLMEIMLPSVTYVNLAVYPLTSLFLSFAFADKSLRQLEMDRALRRKSFELPAFVRTVLCAMSNVLVYEVVNVAYIYLGGTTLTLLHFRRALRDVVLTGLLTALLAIIVRRLIFGKRHETPVLKNQPIVFSKK